MSVRGDSLRTLETLIASIGQAEKNIFPDDRLLEAKGFDKFHRVTLVRFITSKEINELHKSQ